MPFPKKVAVVAGILLVAVFALLLTFLATFDANRYRQYLFHLLSTSLNRQVKGEEVQLNLFPFRLRLNQVEIREDPNFADDSFVRAEGIEVRPGILSLLSDNPVILGFELDRPTIQLRQNSAGAWNVSTLGPASGGGKAGEPPAGEDSRQLQEGVLVRDWGIDDGTLLISRSNGDMITISGLNVALTNVDLQSEIPFQAALHSGDGTVVDVSGTIGPLQPASERFPFRLEATVKDGNLEGVVPLIQAFVATPVSDLKPVGRFSGEALIRRSSKPDETEVTANVQLNNVHLQGERFPIPVQLYQAQLRLERDVLDLTEVRGSLGETQLQGSIHVPDLGRPQFHFSLRGDQLDLEELASLVAHSQKSGGSQEQIDSKSTGWLQRIRGQGQVKLSEFRSGTLTLAPFESDLTLSQGVVTLKPLKFGLYDGSATASLVINTNPQPPAVELIAELRDVDVDRLLKTNGHPGNRLQGLLEGRVELRFQGGSWEAFSRTATGQGEARINDGRLARLNLSGELAAVTRLAGLSANRGDTPLEEMSATFLIGGGWIRTRDLTIQTPDLRLTAEGGFHFDDRLDLEATALFSRESSQKVAGIGLVGKIVGNLLLDQEERAIVPFDVSGTTAEPRFSLDAARLARMRAESNRSQPRELLEDLMQKLQRPPQPPL